VEEHLQVIHPHLTLPQILHREHHLGLLLGHHRELNLEEKEDVKLKKQKRAEKQSEVENQEKQKNVKYLKY